MNDLPSYVNLVFIATTLATIGFIYFAIRATEPKKSFKVSTIYLFGILSWMLVTVLISKSGFLMQFDALPPRFMLIILPANLTVLFLIINKKSRHFIQRMPLSILTYLHVIRIPVEMCIWWWTLAQLAPVMLSFEGINYDILSGVTAPFVAIFMVGTKRKNKIGAIIWNFAALALLFNIVGHAILSIPSPIQQFNFDLPLMAIFYTPNIWLPAVIVPVVFFSHLASLVQLFSMEKE